MKSKFQYSVTGIVLLAMLPVAYCAAKKNSARPLMKVLARFTAQDVPPMGPGEPAVPPLKEAPPEPEGLPGRGMAEHPMLYIGEGYNKILLVNSGRVAWTYSTGPGGEYDDVGMLSNGNVLFSGMQYVAEGTPEKKVVWRFDAPAGTEIHMCQPIGFDKVLFVENGLPPHLIVMNIKTGKKEIDHVLPAISQTDQKTVHAQFRRVRYTAQGTYLVPFLEMGKVVEYDRKFKEIWSYNIPSPWAAVRLRNGNTMITDEHDVLTREVNRGGESVWEIRNTDLPEQYRYANAQSATRLANGDTIICSRGGKNHGPQLVEVTPEKKVAWVLQDWQDFGPATDGQGLREPGKPG